MSLGHGHSVHPHAHTSSHSKQVIDDIDINKINTKTDQVFFEFFGMYAKDSIKKKARDNASIRTEGSKIARHL